MKFRRETGSSINPPHLKLLFDKLTKLWRIRLVLELRQWRGPSLCLEFLVWNSSSMTGRTIIMALNTLFSYKVCKLYFLVPDRSYAKSVILSKGRRRSFGLR